MSCGWALCSQLRVSARARKSSWWAGVWPGALQRVVRKCKNRLMEETDKCPWPFTQTNAPGKKWKPLAEITSTELRTLWTFFLRLFRNLAASGLRAPLSPTTNGRTTRGRTLLYGLCSLASSSNRQRRLQFRGAWAAPGRAAPNSLSIACLSQGPLELTETARPAEARGLAASL